MIKIQSDSFSEDKKHVLEQLYRYKMSDFDKKGYTASLHQLFPDPSPTDIHIICQSSMLSSSPLCVQHLSLWLVYVTQLNILVAPHGRIERISLGRWRATLGATMGKLLKDLEKEVSGDIEVLRVSTLLVPGVTCVDVTSKPSSPVLSNIDAKYYESIVKSALKTDLSTTIQQNYPWHINPSQIHFILGGSAVDGGG